MLPAMWISFHHWASCREIFLIIEVFSGLLSHLGLLMIINCLCLIMMPIDFSWIFLDHLKQFYFLFILNQCIPNCLQMKNICYFIIFSGFHIHLNILVWAILTFYSCFLTNEPYDPYSIVGLTTICHNFFF